MKKLLVLGFALSLFAGCAVVTPYGAGFYVPEPEITAVPYPYYAYPYYAYPYYAYPYYPYGTFSYSFPWYGWRPAWGSWGHSHRFHGPGSPAGPYWGHGGHGGPARH